MSSPPPEAALPSRRRPWRLAVAALVFGLALLGARARRSAPPALPVYWPVPAFSLVDQDGRTLTDGDLRGHPWVADFIFTRCGGACPLMTARLARLQDRLPGGTRLVSISVDPGHDQPAVLKEYASHLGAGPNWSFLTGPRADVYRLSVDGFKLAPMETPDDPSSPFLHSSKWVLVDPEGRIRGFYDSEDEKAVERLLPDVARVAELIPMLTVRDLPVLNAVLNGTSAVLLLIAYVLIRKGRRRAHERFMWAALTSSTLFLTSYVVYHVQVGSVRFRGQGLVRPLYFFILITHVVLAFAIVPLVLVTLSRALRARFDAHRRIARITLPLWGYVSVTGVVIFWMLYRL